MPIRGMEDKREQNKERLKELAFIDDLTGLYNRRYLYQYLPEEMKDVQKAQGRLCLFMMDVDNFKHINDNYGHLSGDKILVKVAEILRQNCRDADTIVRYAGDEFIAILPGADKPIAVNIAKRIVESVSKTEFLTQEDADNVHVTISIGLGFFPHDAQDPEGLISQADRALYSSKRTGRNRISTTDEISEQALEETMAQELFPVQELIGRTAQIDNLKQLLSEAEGSETRFAFIKAEKGLGKTRLMNELKKHAQSNGITNIVTSCSPEISNQPYRILINALDNLFTLLGAEVQEFVRSLPEAQVAQLAIYIPALKPYIPKELKLSQALSDKQAQVDLFKGISQSIVYVVKRNIFLLLIDDFHWIDQQTLQLLNYIITDLHDISLCVVAAYREEELLARSDSGAIKELLDKIHQNELVTEIVLKPLTKEEIAQMISAAFGQVTLSHDFVDVIYGVSLGNPLFAEEVLRSLVNEKVLFYQNGKWSSREISRLSLPPYLKEAIAERLHQLDEETKPVVLAAAVIGQVFSFDVLCQLTEKDEGYVLEVMDRAIKQHLVEPESSLQSDRFKFTSGAVWDVVYDSLDSETKQSLHRKLALIEEKLHQDNIGSAAGNIGYHFSKAQDTQKAMDYSNILLDKASKMPAREDVFGFLQEALLEKIEEIVTPLSDKSLRALPQALRSLRLAIHNVRYYPAQSTIREGFVSRAHKNLADILNRDSILIVATTEKRLLLNGEEIGAKLSRAAGAAEFTAMMIDHRIKSITFKKGLKPEELIVFLGAMAQTYDEVMSQGGISAMLRKKSVVYVRVNEVRYEQTTKLNKQRTQFEEAMLLDYLLGRASHLEPGQSQALLRVANDPKKLAQALEKIAASAQEKKGEDKTKAQAGVIAQSLQRLGEQVAGLNPNASGQYHKNISEVLMALDYKLRSELIQAQGKKAGGAGGKLGKTKDIIQTALRGFSEQQVLEVVTKEFLHSHGDLSNMYNLVQSLLVYCAAKDKLVPKIKAKLIELGVTQDESAWIAGEVLWQGLNTTEKVKRIKELSAQDYIRLDISQQIGKIVSDALNEARYNEAGEIIDALLTMLDKPTKVLRSMVIKDLLGVGERLIDKEKYFLLEQASSKLIARLDQEKDPEVYALLAQTLAAICVNLIDKERFIQATAVLREFNLRIAKEGKLAEIQKQALLQAKDKIITAQHTLKHLAKLLEKKIESHNDFWELSKVFTEIGAKVVEPVFNLTVTKTTYDDPFKTYALRWGVAQVLKRIGHEAVIFLNAKLKDEKKEVVKADLEILGHMQNQNAVKHFASLLQYGDLDIRKEVIVTLGKIGGAEAVKLLSAAVEDKDADVRAACLRALSAIGIKEVLPLLKVLLQDRKLTDKAKDAIEYIERQGRSK